MSCQERAESFARRLQQRLWSLSGSDNEQSDTNGPDEIACLQTSHSTDTTSALNTTNVQNSVASQVLSNNGTDDKLNSLKDPVEKHESIMPLQNSDNNNTFHLKSCNNLISMSDVPIPISTKVKSLNSSCKSLENITNDKIITMYHDRCVNSPREQIASTINYHSPSELHVQCICSASAINMVSFEQGSNVNADAMPSTFEDSTISAIASMASAERPQCKELTSCQNKNNKINENNDDVMLTQSIMYDELTIPRVRRCSSLRSGVTPPGTPCRKKFVRFADVLGLDLADVRTFLDDVPKVPTSAYRDLTDVVHTDATSIYNVGLTAAESTLVLSSNALADLKLERILVAMFQQPGGQPTFLDRVRDDYVCLENAYVEDPTVSSVAGLVRVRNLDYHKSVYLRYTFNSWKTYTDIPAQYVENSCDGFSDKFKFLLFLHTLKMGEKLEFAVRYHCKGSQFWDNNRSLNYAFQCMPSCGHSYDSY